MNRLLKIISVCAGATLAFMPLHPVAAATSKKSSTTTKKKSSTEEKKPAAEDAGGETAGAKKGKSLDLPLPEKVPVAGEKSAEQEKKKPESTPSNSKSSEK